MGVPNEVVKTKSHCDAYIKAGMREGRGILMEMEKIF